MHTRNEQYFYAVGLRVISPTGSETNVVESRIFRTVCLIVDRNLSRLDHLHSSGLHSLVYKVKGSVIRVKFMHQVTEYKWILPTSIEAVL